MGDFCNTLKWHIFNDMREPLCWDGKVIEFDDERSAINFLASYTGDLGILYDDYVEQFGITFEKSIYFCEEGYVNFTNMVVVFNEENDWEGEVISVEENQ